MQLNHTNNTCAWVVSQGRLGCLSGPRGVIIRGLLEASAEPLRGLSGPFGDFSGASGGRVLETSGGVLGATRPKVVTFPGTLLAPF